ncbi:MAG TPA: LLM class flavin-dependent oxidoreductase [Jatrophihabitans sp.]|jgi:alkanesulfonate monooxygenase SsuD/methylene tetrahydromethanopterin reductase-like flavin-dependent oxidoreductase (luciferase family)
MSMVPLRTGVLVGSWPLGMPTDPVSLYATLPSLVEEAGFDSLFVGDHLFAAGPSVDALALASSLAARTTRITIGTGVLQLALREPVAAAKQAATIDCLSGGRFVLGVGVGGEFEAEWSAVGVPRTGRGSRLDETRPGGPPVWVGGRSDTALARAARHQGWLAYASSPRRVRDSVQKLQSLGRDAADGFRVGVVLWTYVAADRAAARTQIGRLLGRRHRQDFDRYVDAFCAVGTVDDVAARVAEFRAAGATDVFFNPQCPADEFLDQVRCVAELASREEVPA